MTSLPVVLLVCLCVDYAAGLSASEAAMFTASNTYSATVSVASSGTNYVISASGMPDHAWQQVNPNTPTSQNYVITVPMTPTVSTTKGCLPMGKIGLARTGVAIFNPLAQGYVNAVEGSSAETMDSCDGHPTQTGTYHYHKLPSSCLWQNEADYLIGVAMDGYPIYGPNTTGYAAWLTSSDLDDCHGKTVGGSYRYVATADFPYLLGCFNGAIVDTSFSSSVTYGCTSASSYTATWNAYLCSCHEITSSRAGSVTSLYPGIFIGLAVAIVTMFT